MYKDTKEIKTGSSLWFCKKSNSAYVSKLSNGTNYFISEVNKQFLSDEYTEIKNGEYFFVSGVETIKELKYTTKINLLREKDRSSVIIRYEDLFHFCTN